MMKVKLWMPVIIGLVAGQLFAESERPFKVVNTVRFGYTDNLYRNAEAESSTFVTDIIDLSYRAALSDRTDLMVRSQLNLIDDKGDSAVYPNLYAMLSHNISPRLLMRLSEYYRSGEKSGGDSRGLKDGERIDYFFNKVTVSADYVLTGKDRLEGSVGHSILRHDDELSHLDYTLIDQGVSWRRELSPQRTFSTVNLRHSRLTYDEVSPDGSSGVESNSVVVGTNHYSYLDKSGYDLIELTAGLNHTFNPNWQAHFEAGVNYKQPDYSDYTRVFTATNGTSDAPVREKNSNDPQWLPVFSAGVMYSPSPVTRLTADLDMSFSPSDDDGYNGQSVTEVALGAQHDLTARLMAKVTARFSTTEYSEEDRKTATETAGSGGDEERMDLEFRLTYKLNRMHFLEAGVKHTEKTYDVGDGWDENRVDIGWRVELN